MIMVYLYSISLLLYFFLPQAGPLYAHLIGPIAFYILLRILLYFVFDIELAKANDYVFTLDSKGINDSHIVGSLQLESSIGPDYLLQEIQKGFFSNKHSYKLKKCLKSFLWINMWINQDNFSLTDHVVAIHEHLTTEEQLSNFMSAHMAALPFQENKPKWMIYYFPNFLVNKSALVLKIHHSYGDGLSLLSLVLHLSKDRDFKMVQLRQPTFLQKIMIYILGFFKFFKTLSRVLCLNRDNNYFHDSNMKLTGVKKIGNSKPYNLDDLKRLAKRFNATINDLIVTIILESLKRYSFKWHNQTMDHLLVMIPASLRPIPGPGKTIEITNQVMAIFLEIPLVHENPKETEDAELGRVFSELIHYRNFLKGHKSSYEMFIEMYITGFLGLFLPLCIYKYLLLPTASKPSCFCSTVPGPLNEIKFLGVPVKQSNFFTNVIGDVALGFSSFSYNGRVQFSLITDEATGIRPDEYLRELDIYINECLTTYS